MSQSPEPAGRSQDGVPPASPPGVSVVVPVLNEESHLRAAVENLLAQTYAGPMEVVLALGPSTDGTDRVAAALASSDPRVRLVPNPSGRTPTGLNAAVAAATHDIVVRVDGHAFVPDGYVAAAVDVLERTGADNVGGIMAAQGVTIFEQAVARAMTSRLGVGGASFHVGGAEGPALTVYLGAFRRAALERVGGYDESMVRAQDWEMNRRIRETGGLVWFTPRMTVTYRPRPRPRALARQYFEYGRWRREIARRHPETLSARYLAAPVAVLGVVVGTLLGLLSLGGPAWLALGWLAPVGYLALVVGGSVVVGRGLPSRSWLLLPLVLATMHGSWGMGFLTSPRGLSDGAGQAPSVAT
ncbi:MAG TPA: glycosyltransferase family 2 protein [Candidatus Angelobacter sp.]|nr:glycosyltransferase family 2 protein [Candidatus Angelobacter sp.]